MTQPVLASGGLVFRPSSSGFEILVVHRPGYDDWSLPKGKDDPGETSEAAAVREVEEETGVHGRIVAHLPTTEYTTGAGTLKVVRWYAMRPQRTRAFSPNSEVDEIRWVDQTEATALLTYDFDRHLVTEADLGALSLTGAFFLVRHANAGDRGSWTDDDRLRPLSKKGRRQAAALADALGPRGIDRVWTSPYVRCVETVEPLGEASGVAVEAVDWLAEGSGAGTALDRLAAVAGEQVVVCSHGDVIPDLLRLLQMRGVTLWTDGGMFECRKASVWEVSVVGGTFVEGRYLAPPKA